MRCTQRVTCLITLAITGLAPMVTAAAAPSEASTAHRAKGCITVTATIHLRRASFPGWAAADPKTNTIYVTNAVAHTVAVISGQTNTVTATIPVGRFPQGAAVNPKTNTIYVTRGDAVSVINGRTNTVTATIHGSGGPFGVAVDPTTNTIYVANNYVNTVSIINGQTNAVTATIHVGTSPVGVAVDPVTHTAYVVNSLGPAGGDAGATVSVLAPCPR